MPVKIKTFSMFSFSFFLLSSSLLCLSVLPFSSSHALFLPAPPFSSPSLTPVWLKYIICLTSEHISLILHHQQDFTLFRNFFFIVSLSDRISIGSAVSEHLKSVYIFVWELVFCSEIECNERKARLVFFSPSWNVAQFYANSSL